MLPPLPRCSGWAHSSLKICPSVSAFPETTIGSVCTSSFSRIARRSLTLRPAHSRGHHNCDRYPKASDISSPPCLLRLLPAGAVAGRGLHPLEKRRLVTAHVERRPYAAGFEVIRAKDSASPGNTAANANNRQLNEALEPVSGATAQGLALACSPLRGTRLGGDSSGVSVIFPGCRIHATVPRRDPKTAA